MLKIKDFDNNRDKLLKYGFKYVEYEFTDFYIYEKELYFSDERISIEVDTKRGFIKFGDNHMMEKWYIPNVIYDLINDDLLEKVDEE